MYIEHQLYCYAINSATALALCSKHKAQQQIKKNKGNYEHNKSGDRRTEKKLVPKDIKQGTHVQCFQYLIEVIFWHYFQNEIGRLKISKRTKLSNL